MHKFASSGAPVVAASALALSLGALAFPVTPAAAAGTGHRGTARTARTPRTVAAARWRAAKLPAPKAPKDPGQFITSLQCTSPGNCVALGTTVDAKAEVGIVALTESNGSWSVSKLPMPGGIATANLVPLAIECSGPGDCVGAASNDVLAFTVTATGARAASRATGRNNNPLVIFTDTNGTWTSTLAPPLPGKHRGAFVDVAGLACALGSCTVIATDAQNLRPVVVTGSGVTWSSAYLPAPAAAETYLTGLSCPGAGSCTAVGSRYDSYGRSLPLVLSESGGTWSASTPPPAVPGDQSGLDFVDCVTTTACTVAGVYQTATTDTPEILTGSGGSWTATALTPPSPGSGGKGDVTLSQPTALACADARDCAVSVATQSFSTTSLQSTFGQGWMADESGGSWSTQALAAPAGSPSGSYAVPSALSCTGAGACAAAGETTSASGESEAMVARLARGSWTAQLVPFTHPAASYAPSSAGSLGGSSGALSPAALIASGSPPSSAAVELRRVQALLGRQPSRARDAAPVAPGRLPQRARLGATPPGSPLVSTLAPAPAVGILNIGLSTISCPAPGTCEAAGGYLDSFGNTHGLLADIAAGSVTARSAPIPAGSGAADHAVLATGTACSRGAHCVIVGEVVNDLSGATVGAVALEQTKNGWRTESVRPPRGFGATNVLIEVTCSGTSACTALGAATGPSGERIFAATEHGSRWSTRALPRPRGLSPGSLIQISSLSCAGDRCLAGGLTARNLGDYVAAKTHGILYWESKGHWTERAAPWARGAKHGPSVITATACASDRFCVATGLEGELLSSQVRPYVVTGAGSSWHAEQPSARYAGHLRGEVVGPVACTSRELCWVLGSGFARSGATHGFMLVVTPRSTTAVDVPAPAGGTQAQPQDVSCSTTTCVAAGFYLLHHRARPDVVVGSGTSLRAVATPGPIPAPRRGWAAGPLLSVACSRNGTCAAIGTSRPRTPSNYLVEGSGMSWAASLAPVPRGFAAGKSTLGALACPGAGGCVAIGDAPTPRGLYLSYADVES